MGSYKYYAALTSQIGFCATPLRLDSYSRCQFSCAYCFATTRQGFGRGESLKSGNPKSLEQRLNRVTDGKVASALDEFISKRIPFQLGGMSDPFTKNEEKSKTTLEYLKVLSKFDYPVIISTKSDLIATEEYLEVITKSNIYVRFSTTVIDDALRSKIDKGCPSINKISDAARTLSDIGVPVSFRFQPIIPGHEKHFYDLLEVAAHAGVKHISAEYLKVPIDANKKFSKNLISLLNGNPISFYRDKGAVKSGREYTLPLSYRKSSLVEMALSTREQGITFGFADNELLLHSDGVSCCSASDLYLINSNYFKANIVALVNTKNLGEYILFSDYLSGWIPKQSISTYLNSTARIKVKSNEGPEWLQYLKKMWSGTLGIYSPDFFDGIEKTTKIDENGLPIYIRKKSQFEMHYDAEKLVTDSHNTKLKLINS